MARINGTVSQNTSRFRFYLDAVETSYSIENNTSNVRVSVMLDYVSWGWTTGNAYTISCNVNGQSKSATYVSNVSYGSTVTKTIATFDFTNIAHNADGSKSVSVSCAFYASGTYSPGTCSANGTLTLTTIPRASSISASPVSTFLDGSPVVFSITRAVSSFIHDVYVNINNGGNIKIGDDVATSLTWQPDSSLSEYFGETNAKVTAVVTCETYNGGTKIGSKSINITLQIPNIATPKITGISSTIDYGNAWLESKKYIVAGYASISVSVSAETNQTYKGAKLKTASFVVQGTTKSKSPFNSGDTIGTTQIGQAVSTEPNITVEDSRGFKTSQKDTAFDVLAYNQPTVKVSQSRKGNTLTLTATPNISLTDNLATMSLTIDGSVITVTDWANVANGVSVTWSGELSPVDTHDVEITITDLLGNTSAPIYIFVPTAFRIFSASNTKNIAAFGGVFANIDDYPLQFRQDADKIGIGADEMQSLADLILQYVKNNKYDVHEICVRYDQTSPASLYGGTWERISHRFLYGASSSDTIGGTGGEENVTLNLDQIPVHSHLQRANGGGGGGTQQWLIYPDKNTSGGEVDTIVRTGNSGGGQSHNNMPPYMYVAIWRRVS